MKRKGPTGGDRPPESPGPTRPRSRSASDAEELCRFALWRLSEREAERRRIARVLHDELGQALLALNLGLYRVARRHPQDMDLLGQVDELRAVLEDAARGTGRLAAGFRPGNAAAGQLRAVVLTAIERFHAECGSGCLVTVDEPAATIPLEQAQATALNTLLLLALAGVARHQRAARALVHARVEACRIVVEIRGPAQTGVRETVPSRSDRRSRASRRIEFDELDAWLRALGGALRFGDGDESFLLRLELPLAPP